MQSMLHGFLGEFPADTRQQSRHKSAANKVAVLAVFNIDNAMALRNPVDDEASVRGIIV